MPYQYQSPEAVCPFYRYEEPRAVTCEGVQEGSTIRLRFTEGGEAAMSDYKRRHCRGDWESCLIAEILNKKFS